jgi:hypothetical protein
MSTLAQWVERHFCGPDKTLAHVCECGHNRAQHNFGHDACNAADDGCRRFAHAEAAGGAS